MSLKKRTEKSVSKEKTMDWLTSNFGSILSAITYVVTAASIVAKFTTTETDDIWIARILKVVDFLALNNAPTMLKKD